MRPRRGWIGTDWVDPLVGGALAVGALAIYTRTMAPSLGGTIDSAEFQQAAYSLSIVHPTGYPLYLLVARAWISVFPFGDAAFRVNLLSAIFGALAVWVLYASVRRLTRSIAAGGVAAALFAVQAIPWAQAGVAEVNSLNTLLTGLAFLCALMWAEGRLPLPWLALAYGLAASHHRTAVLYAPLLLLFMLAAMKWASAPRPTLRTLAISAAIFVAPFAAYLYFPLRGGTDPGYLNTWQGFLNVALGESALPVIRGALSRPLVPRLRALLTGDMFFGWTGLALAALALLGVVWAIFVALRRSRLEVAGEARSSLAALGTLLYAAAFALGLGFATVYDILDITDYLAVPIFMACVLAGVGIAAIVGAARALARDRVPLRAWAVVALVVGAIVTWAAATSSLGHTAVRVDFRELDVRSYWAPIMADDRRIPQRAHIIADWPQANEARYLQRAERWRTDLDFVVADYIVATGLAPIDRWLEAGEPVFMIGEEGAILQDFTTERQGALWRVVARASERDRPAPPMAHALDRRYGESILLLGYTLEPEPPVLVPGGLLRVTLYWKALKPVSERYVVFNHLIDANGAKYGQKDDEPGRGLKATVSWTAGEVVTDTMPIAVSPNAPPGTYRLMTGLYPRLGERRLGAFDPTGASLGDYPLLSEVTIRAGHR